MPDILLHSSNPVAGGRNGRGITLTVHQCEASAEHLSDTGPKPLGFIPESRSACTGLAISERNIVVSDRDGLIDPRVKKNASGLIEQLLAVHKNNVAALSGIELSHKPASRGFRNLACRD